MIHPVHFVCMYLNGNISLVNRNDLACINIYSYVNFRTK